MCDICVKSSSVVSTLEFSATNSESFRSDNAVNSILGDDSTEVKSYGSDIKDDFGLRRYTYLTQGLKNDNEEPKDTRGQTPFLLVLPCLTSLTAGIFFSWPSPFILKISKDKVNYDISEEETSKFPTIPFMTLMICCPIFSKLSDIYGRKRVLLISAFTDLSIWILKATGKSVYVFYFARALSGISDGIMFGALPAYLGEVTTPKVRGTWGNAMTVFFVSGQLLITVVGSNFNVQETCYIFLPIPILFFVSFSFMPESPYFYIMRGRYDEAKQSLRSLHRKKDVIMEFLSLRADVERQLSEEGTWKEVFKVDSNRRAFAAGTFLRMSHIVGGSLAFICYTQYIFDQSIGTFTTEISSMIFMGLVLIVGIIASYAVNCVKRRTAYIWSVIPCAVALLIEAIYFFIQQNRPDIDITPFNWIPITGMILYSIFSSYGINLMPTLMLGELFSISFRAKAMSLLIILCGILAIITNSLFYFLTSNYGLFAPFLFFSCCDIVSAVIAYFILPETKDRTLEEIQQAMKGKNYCKTLAERQTLMNQSQSSS